MKFFIRTLEALVQPIGFTWICLTIGCVIFYRKKQKGAAVFCGLLSAFLWIVGATPLPEWLLARLERPYASMTAAQAAPAHAAIILGGNMISSGHDAFGIGLTSSADRIVTGIELLRLGKVRALIIGGGPGDVDGKLTSEGHRFEQLLKTWNIAPGEIIGLAGCANTREEALRTQTILAAKGWTNLILVTSGFHMPRALATFQKAGVTARPVACDFEGLPMLEGELAGFRLVPVFDHMRNFGLYLHEVIGRYYYAARGWI